MLIAVNFHYVRPNFDAPYPGVHGVTPAQLRRQLEALGTIGAFVSQSDIIAAVEGGSPLPERALVVTFDDGLREQIEHAWPILRQLGIPAIFFPNTRPIRESRLSAVHKIHLLRAHTAPSDLEHALSSRLEQVRFAMSRAVIRERAVEHYKYDTPHAAEQKYILNFLLQFFERDRLIDDLFGQLFDGSEQEIARMLYMTHDDLSMLARAEALGSHAHEHLPLGQLDDNTLAAQLRQSVASLVHITGVAPKALSYPYGSRESTGRRAAEIAAQCGFRFGFTMERAKNTDLREPFLLARFDNNDLPEGKACVWPINEVFERSPESRWWGEL